MKTKAVAQHKQRLDALFKLVQSLPSTTNTDIELRSHLARYLCVLTSGFVESSVRHILSEYAKARAAPEIQKFVESKLREFQNAKMEKILLLVQCFNERWEENLRVSTEGELKDAVDSVVTTRHSIAHGGSTGITYATIQSYYEAVVKVVEELEKCCGL